VAQVQALMPEANGFWGLFEIACAPLMAAHTASIRKRDILSLSGNGPATCRQSASCSLLLRPADQGALSLKVLENKSESALLYQPAIGVAMHGSVRSGSMVHTSTRSGLTPSCQLNNLLRQDI